MVVSVDEMVGFQSVCVSVPHLEEDALQVLCVSLDIEEWRRDACTAYLCLQRFQPGMWRKGWSILVLHYCIGGMHLTIHLKHTVLGRFPVELLCLRILVLTLQRVLGIRGS